jgi:hypothetical protein
MYNNTINLDWSTTVFTLKFLLGLSMHVIAILLLEKEIIEKELWGRKINTIEHLGLGIMSMLPGAINVLILDYYLDLFSIMGNFIFVLILLVGWICTFLAHRALRFVAPEKIKQMAQKIPSY